MSLATDYRPTQFSDFVGQNSVKTVLSKMVEEGTVPRALLFEGPKGSGKTSMARVLAKALAGDNYTMAVTEIDGASNGLVDDVRRLQEMLFWGVGSDRVIIIDEAQSMSRAAFNALLKILEEPPYGVYFILVTTEVHKIPETIVSRCISFQFKKIDSASILARLLEVAKVENYTISVELLGFLSERADGSLRTALMLLDESVRAGIETIEGYEYAHGEVDFAPTMLAQLAKGNLAAAYSTLLEVSAVNTDHGWIQDQMVKTLRDVLIIHTGGEPSARGLKLDRRKAVAGKINSVKAVAALRVLWEAKTKVKSVEDIRLITDMVLALLADTLTEGGLK